MYKVMKPIQHKNSSRTISFPMLVRWLIYLINSQLTKPNPLRIMKALADISNSLNRS